MRILLAVPSYNRPYDIEKKTGYWLKQLKDIHWKVFIREEQLIYYQQVLPLENIVTINVNSFRETINAMGKYAIDHNYDYVHFVADDMSFNSKGKTKKQYSAEVYEKLYKDIKEKLIEDPEIYGVSVAKPMMYLRRNGKVWGRENKLLYGNIMLKSEYMHMPEGIYVFQDVFSAMKILKDGFKTITYYGAMENAIMLKNKGGLQSDNKRNELASMTLKTMQTMFDNIRQGSRKGDKSFVDIDLKYTGLK